MRHQESGWRGTACLPAPASITCDAVVYGAWTDPHGLVGYDEGVGAVLWLAMLCCLPSRLSELAASPLLQGHCLNMPGAPQVLPYSLLRAQFRAGCRSSVGLRFRRTSQVPTWKWPQIACARWTLPRRAQRSAGRADASRRGYTAARRRCAKSLTLEAARGRGAARASCGLSLRGGRRHRRGGASSPTASQPASQPASQRASQPASQPASLI